jgi:hypothetical protein
LIEEHVHPSGAFRVMTPEGWSESPVPDRPEAWDVKQGLLTIRFLYFDRESGFDSLHADCMLVRFAAAMEIDPHTAYEYDFLSGAMGEHRFLDSAFLVRYDEPVGGHREWRQRNLTLVGAGESLCVISYAPWDVYKKDRATRWLVEAIVKTLSFPERAAKPQ